MNKELLTKRAKLLRTNQTKAEKKLWYHLRAKRFEARKFYRQFIIEPFIVDFICRKLKFIIEVDGGQHDENKAKDEIRTQYLNKKGYQVIRFWNNEVLENFEGVMETLSLTLSLRERELSSEENAKPHNPSSNVMNNINSIREIPSPPGRGLGRGKEPGRKKQKAFTLIEILVATVILFSSIATVTMIYRGAFTSSEKANAHVTISGVVPAVLSQIREQIRSQGNTEQTELSANGISWDVKFNWNAKQAFFKAAPPNFDMDNGDMVEAPIKYKLWIVDLALTYQGIKRNYQFKELSWNEL